jgi:hypothetical protein
MKGIKEITSLRINKFKPELVNVWVGNGDLHMATEWYKYSDTMDYPQLQIENEDIIGLIDFRFVIDLEVILSGDNSDRLMDVYEKMTRYNPKRLVLLYEEKNGSVEILDNKGLLSGILE